MKTYHYDEHGKLTGYSESDDPITTLFGWFIGFILGAAGLVILVSMIVAANEVHP